MRGYVTTARQSLSAIGQHHEGAGRGQDGWGRVRGGEGLHPPLVGEGEGRWLALDPAVPLDPL